MPCEYLFFFNEELAKLKGHFEVLTDPLLLSVIEVKLMLNCDVISDEGVVFCVVLLHNPSITE